MKSWLKEHFVAIVAVILSIGTLAFTQIEDSATTNAQFETRLGTIETTLDDRKVNVEQSIQTQQRVIHLQSNVEAVGFVVQSLASRVTTQHVKNIEDSATMATLMQGVMDTNKLIADSIDRQTTAIGTLKTNVAVNDVRLKNLEGN